MSERGPIFQKGLIGEMGFGASRMKFPYEVKQEVRHKQGCKCAVCGMPDPHLPVHHRVPQSLGGADTPENAVGVCQDHHNFLDEMALKHRIILDQSRRPIPIRAASGTLFKNGVNPYK